MDAILNSRFALVGRDGTLKALVADGLPEWPADLTTIPDAALAEMETAYLAEFHRLEGIPDSDTTVAVELAQRVAAIRADAGRRFAEAAAAAEAAAGDPEAAAAAEAARLAAEAEAAAAATAAAEAAAAEREAAMAAARALLSGSEPAPAPGTEIPAGVQFSRDDLVAAVTAGAEAGARAAAAALEPALAAVTAAAGAPRETVPATARRVSAADLGGYRPDALAPQVGGEGRRSRFQANLVSLSDTEGLAMGGRIERFEQLRDLFMKRFDTLGRAAGVDDEKVPLAQVKIDIPAERDLRNIPWAEARKRIMAIVGKDAVGIDPWTGKEALIASGGLAAPVEPYYPQLVIAQGARPVQAALPTFVAERGGIKLVLPPSISSVSAATRPGLFADGVTNTDTSLVSATAAFNAADVGKPVLNVGASTVFAAGTIISSVTNATTVVLSAATTSTGTGVSFYLPGRNPNNLGPAVAVVTAAQDAAGPPNTVKFTYDVPDGSQTEFDVYSVYTSLQFANLTARTFPEQVEANIRVADALAARVAETQMLDVITAWSTLFTGAKTFGTARQLLTQLEHMAAFYRNSERMDPMAVLRCGVPAWAINAMRADYLSTFIGGGAQNWGLSDDEIAGFFQQIRVVPFFYQDGPSDISQLFSTTGLSGATNTGINSATPIAIPDYPGTGVTTSFRTKVVSFMWAEGTWLGLTTGELNLGLVRDSILNSQNRFRNFQEEWETPAFVGTRSLRGVHTVAADGTYGAAASITLGAGSGI